MLPSKCNNEMKKIRIYILTIAAGLLMVPMSCTKDYLETSPTNQLSGNDVFTTISGAWGAINGVHRLMYIQYNSTQAHGGFAGLYEHIDFLGADLVFNNTASTWFLNTYKWVDHRNQKSSTVLYWTNLYRLIGNVNQIINNIDAIVGSDGDKKAIKGQALTYRAWAHFMLVQLFADRYVPGGANSQLGVPYMEVITYDGQARNTVAEVYTKINADLVAAITNLEGYNRANKSHLNKSVALAVQAQVALVQGNWTLAASSANAAKVGYTFMTTAQQQDGYKNQSNPENLWCDYVQDDQTLYFYSFFAYMSNNYNSTVIRTCPKSIPKELYDKIAATDVRKTFWYPNAVADKMPEVPPAGVRYAYMSSKFKAVSVSDSRGDFAWIRVPEMYLIEAEALARSGKETESKAVLYLLAKDRNPQYVLSTNTGQALIDEILVQRRIELWGEGRSWTDLKRLNLPMVRTIGLNAGQGLHVEAYCTVYNVPAGGSLWNWMIPQSEIDSNPLIVQNP
jgi:hypothetical protein